MQLRSAKAKKDIKSVDNFRIVERRSLETKTGYGN